jgi:hypothetical protein
MAGAIAANDEATEHALPFFTGLLPVVQYNNAS